MKKGQFMMISSVAIGLIVISTASMVSQANSQTYSNKDTAYTIQMIKDEARKADMGSSKERENFRETVSMIDSYYTQTSYSDSRQCFNVTLQKTNEEYFLECIN